MKIKGTPNFSKLKKRLTGLALVDLVRLSPEYVYGFTEEASRGELPSHTMPSVVSRNPQFQKWRSICVDLMDVEYHKHRLFVCLNLMNSKNPSSISEGEWLNHQLGYWAVLTQGLISKSEKLFKNTYRKFPTHRSSETDLKAMLRKLHEYHTRLKRLRDPVAHPGGPVRIFGEDQHLGPYIILRGDFDLGTFADGMTDYYPKWISISSQFTNDVLMEIDGFSKSLIALLPKITG